MSEPKTLQDAIIYFADADNCLNFLRLAPLAEQLSLPRLWIARTLP